MTRDFRTFKIMEKVGLSENFNGIVWFFRKIPFLGELLGDQYRFSEAKQVIHAFYPIFVLLKNLLFSVLGFFISLSLVNLGLGAIYGEFGTSIMGGLTARSDMYKIAHGSFAWAYMYVSLNLLRDGVYDNIDKVKKFTESFYLDPASIVRASMYFSPLISLATRSIVVAFGLKALGVGVLPGLLMSLVLYFYQITGEVFWLRNRYLYGKNLANRTLTKVILYILIVFGLFAIRVFTGLSKEIFLIGFLISSILGFIWARSYMRKFDGYGKIVEESLREYDDILETAENQEETRVELKDSDLAKGASSKEGFAYLNDLFFIRHRRILRKPVLIKSAILAGVLVLAFIGTSLVKDLAIDMPDLLIRLVPLISYMVCKQGAILTAFYLNCDMGLMPYGFYRDPKNLLAMYKERTISLFKINLIPSAVFILGFVGFFLRDRGIDIISLIEGSAYILLAGVFFTSLPIGQYYLLQPFDSEGKRTGKLAGIVDFAVYYFCIYSIGITADIPTRTLILGASAFIVVFTIITSLLIVKIGPRTFRVKN